MSLSLIAAGVLFAQSAAGFTVPAPADSTPDVGYSLLVQGNPAGAIEHIRASGALERKDPTALINLGTAYAMLGQKAAAHDAYAEAKFSPMRFDVELADGKWVDSRDAAIMAERSLDNGTMIALR